MIDTNALLNIAFSIAASFTNAVYIPPECVPQSTNDLAAYYIGSPVCPTDVYIRHKCGTQFWISDGAVWQFEVIGSYFTLQDPRQIAKFVGQPQITSNEVFQLAATAVRQLVKSGDPIANTTPRVKAAAPYRGQPVPFYRIRWHPPNDAAWHNVAEAGVDARSGRIVSLALFDVGFQDPDRASRITAAVFKPDPPKPAAPRVRTLPLPATNEVAQALADWLRVCQMLSIDLGGQTNLGEVDWDNTTAFQSPLFAPPRPGCNVVLSNKTCFSSCSGIIFYYRSRDAYYPVEPYRWKQFQGRINHRWEDLASRLEGALEAQFGVPKAVFLPLRPRAPLKPPAVGTEGLTRAEVVWGEWSGGGGAASPDQARIGLTAEFDLASGDIKAFAFRDPKLIEALERWRAESGSTPKVRLCD
jgi:hypothetical protein